MVAEEMSYESRGQDVENAIEIGLAELELKRSDVDVEVVDEGSSGFLGLGGREAVVILKLKKKSTENIHLTESSTSDPSGELSTVLEAEPGREDEEEQSEKEVVLGIVNDLLDKMGVEATTTTYQTEPDDLTGERRLVVDIRGENMGVLIGPRGETLNSFQYMSRMMTGHILRKRTGFIIDVEGYREKRETALARLAERMANKAISRGQPVSLEPMPANERRIIHLTLRDNDQVYTESWGDGNRRKVRIYPK